MHPIFSWIQLFLGRCTNANHSQMLAQMRVTLTRGIFRPSSTRMVIGHTNVNDRSFTLKVSQFIFSLRPKENENQFFVKMRTHENHKEQKRTISHFLLDGYQFVFKSLNYMLFPWQNKLMLRTISFVHILCPYFSHWISTK